MKEDERFSEFVAKCRKYNVPHDVPFLYPDEVMVILRCKKNTLYRLMNSGKLKFVKEKGEKRRKISPQWVVEYFDALLTVPASEAA